MTDDELREIEQWCKKAKHPHQTVSRLLLEVRMLQDENAELREGLTEAAWAIFDEHMAPSNRDDAPASDGWLVTNAQSDALYYGDMLVRLGHVEKHPTAGVGRVQYYRPLKGDKK